jgi:serine/threonine protein kinase
MPLEPGTLLINRYRVLDILGQGGMGSVYRATDENLGVCVAVKENLFLSDEYARQFRLEANILAGLRHPSLPRMGDHFVIDRQGQYLVMDYIEGDDLRQLMDRSGPLAESEVIRVGVAICDALSYLHTRIPPIVHRDIKPGNIKLTPDGQVVLVDFGLAKIMMGDESTTTGARAMTPGYSPPEQYGTAHTDPRSDIYSLGATLYVALTNVVPEDGLARLTGNAVLTNPRKLNPAVNRKLTSVVVKALAVDQDARYQTAEDFKQALLEAQSDTHNNASRPVSRPSTPYLAEVLNEAGNSQPKVNGVLLGIKAFLLTQWKWVLGGSIVLALAMIVAVYGSRMGSSGFIFTGAFRQPSSTPSPTTTTLPAKRSATPLPAVISTVVHVILMDTPTLSVGTALATDTPAASATPFLVADKSEQIAFVSERSGKPQLWLMNSDGSDLHQVTNLKDGACQPDWSPDGKRLVFISPCPSMASGRYVQFPGSSLHLINADGTGLVDLPLAPEGDFDPAWSPDGTQIAFTSLKDGHPQIYLLNLDTKIRRHLSDNNFKDRQPAWSPDGKLLAFVRLYGTYQIWIIQVDGSDPKQVTRSNELNDMWPAWTPDGSIVFFGQTDLDTVLPWLMAIRYEDLGTNKEFRIPALRQTDFGFIAQVRISPDNHWITFEGWSGPDSHDIWVMTIAGAERQRLTSNSDLDYSPVWRPIIK